MLSIKNAFLLALIAAIFAQEPSNQWIAAITAVAITVGLISQIVLQVMARVEAARTAKELKDAAALATEAAKQASAVAKDSAEKAAVKAEDVRKTLEVTEGKTDTKLDNLAKVASATHMLVNSNMAVQLKLNAAVTRRLADLTKDPEDIKAAALAEGLYREHETKQANVDAKDAKDAKG